MTTSESDSTHGPATRIGIKPCPSCGVLLSIYGAYVVCRVPGCGWPGARLDYWTEVSRQQGWKEPVAFTGRLVQP